MDYQEKFEITSNTSDYFSNQFDILITGFRSEDDLRHTFFKNALAGFQGLTYSFDTCENSEKLLFKIEKPNAEIVDSGDNFSLIPDLEKLLKTKGFQGSRVCIDITSIKQGILFLLIKLFINDIKPSFLFASYTEPTDYKKRKIIDIGETEEYDLYDKIIGSSKGVPGFIKHRGSKPILLIAPMGFDSQRLQTIFENLKPKRLVPIVGFPSFIPGWDLTAIKMNYMVLKSSNCFDMIERCEAASPFEMYSLIETYYHRFISDYDIYISPLGTRPHCLGAAIFASRFPSVQLVYDFPVEKKFRSENVLRSNIYHLSKYIS